VLPPVVPAVVPAVVPPVVVPVPPALFEELLQPAAAITSAAPATTNSFILFCNKADPPSVALRSPEPLIDRPRQTSPVARLDNSIHCRRCQLTSPICDRPDDPVLPHRSPLHDMACYWRTPCEQLPAFVNMGSLSSAGTNRPVSWLVGVWDATMRSMAAFSVRSKNMKGTASDTFLDA
jgi:hypothetical protein